MEPFRTTTVTKPVQGACRRGTVREPGQDPWVPSLQRLCQGCWQPCLQPFRQACLWPCLQPCLPCCLHVSTCHTATEAAMKEQTFYAWGDSRCIVSSAVTRCAVASFFSIYYISLYLVLECSPRLVTAAGHLEHPSTAQHHQHWKWRAGGVVQHQGGILPHRAG